MPARSEANALSDGNAGAAPAVTATQVGHVALGHTECDVVRGAGAPDNISLSNDGGTRVAVLTYAKGPRAGIYTFNAGRLRSIEKLPEPVAPVRSSRAKPRKHHAR
jgi:hypothetical protein